MQRSPIQPARRRKAKIVDMTNNRYVAIWPDHAKLPDSV